MQPIKNCYVNMDYIDDDESNKNKTLFFKFLIAHHYWLNSSGLYGQS